MAAMQAILKIIFFFFFFFASSPELKGPVDLKLGTHWGDL